MRSLLSPGGVRSESVQVGGLRLHARTSCQAPVPYGGESRKPPLLLVHGIVVSSRYMVPVMEHLAPDFDVFALDLPGFGLSAKPDRAMAIKELADCIAGWMDALGLGRVSLLGNSIGCQIVVDFAIRHPHRVEAVVLVGPTMDPEARTPLRALLRWLREGRNELQMMPIWIWDLLDCRLSQQLCLFRESLRDPMEEKLSRVRVPTLVVRGSRDPIATCRWVEQIAGLLPEGRAAVVPGYGHPLNYVAPLELSRLVRSHLGTRAEISGV